VELHSRSNPVGKVSANLPLYKQLAEFTQIFEATILIFDGTVTVFWHILNGLSVYTDLAMDLPLTYAVAKYFDYRSFFV
jgi:hypothetical protein